MNAIKKNFLGVLLCTAISIPAWLLGKYYPLMGGPVFGILIGMLITLCFQLKESFQAGINFTSKKILQYAVILLGFGLNLSVIFSTGKQSLPIILSTISISLLLAYILHKAMNIPSKISILIGVGSSICGGSAVAATAPVIDADDQEVAQSISVIFLFNVLAALIFPTLGGCLGMSTEGFGLFAGTAINDTSSVTAAAAAWDGIHKGSNALEIATIVKLTRTLAIIPITLALAFFKTRKEKALNSQVKIKKIFPFFIIYFLLASVITTIFHLSPEITEPIKELSKFFIIMAMSAIGLHTHIVELIKKGGQPIFLGLCCWLGITAVSILMQFGLGLV
ncbi:YeiH family protein [Aminipila sp.]|uniref:YeiH family protein n=1 Tax=Aminipila sp. TaxID=2060095 RepID=UPI001DD756D2|nr:YeiH family protein [Aminipila sp.]MBE6033962.1 YeiH family putative sulfate export transporter [Clostridiales bacterium]